MDKQFVQLIVVFIVLTSVFWLVEYAWPGVRGQKFIRRGFGTDILYWFFTPLVTKAVSKLAVLIALVPVFLLLGRKLDAQSLAAGYGPVLTLPTWLQVVLIVVLGDFIGYWVHRGFHSRRLWKFHAVHHSAHELNWLSALRLHPVNDVVARICQAVPFVVLGFSPMVIAAYVPFLTFYAILLHANVSWTYGPLGQLIASPTFHRWHHSDEQDAADKNFAGLFPIFDRLFGTLYLPKDERPKTFGAPDDAVPDNFLGQMTYPFWRDGGRLE